MNSYDDLREAIRTHAFVTSVSGAQIIKNEAGTSSPWLFDFRALLLQPKWLDRYAEIFWEKYASRYPFQVCAMESAGISLVAAIVMKSVERGTPVNGFFIRKSRKRQGLMKQIEGIVTDEPVIMVDDLINSGSTFNKMLKILDEEKRRVSDIFALLAFRDMSAYEFATTRNIHVDALFTLKDFGLPLLPAESAAIPKESFETLWHFQAKDPSFHFVVQKSAPVIDERHVYFGTDSGTFYALNQSDGSIVWTFETKKHPEGKGIFSSPALCNDTVFFGAYDGNVYALEAKTGKVRWTYSKADWIGSSPSVAPDLGLVFIGLEFGLFRKRGGIAALDLKTGKEMWSARTSEQTHGSPLYIKEEDLVVIGSNDGIAYAYDAKKGGALWRYTTEGDIKTTFAYDAKRRTVLFGSMDGKLYALSAHDGTPIFAFETGAGIYSIPLVVEDTVYVASLDKTIYAIDLETGSRRASFDTNGRIFASPILAEGSIWIGSNDGRLYELESKTLKLKSFFQTTERIVNRIAYNPKTKRFFIPTVANELYCLLPKPL
jgi:outer membrane protein assembly factor BamB/adenine/guanine phosphoribosyltransferase-like PRPP-binding protein